MRRECLRCGRRFVTWDTGYWCVRCLSRARRMDRWIALSVAAATAAVLGRQLLIRLLG
jgi:hypothetical protein